MLENIVCCEIHLKSAQFFSMEKLAALIWIDPPTDN